MVALKKAVFAISSIDLFEGFEALRKLSNVSATDMPSALSAVTCDNNNNSVGKPTMVSELLTRRSTDVMTLAIDQSMKDIRAVPRTWTGR